MSKATLVGMYSSVFLEERGVALAALRVGAAIEASGLPNKEVCALAGVSAGTLRRLLNASGNVSIRTMAKVAYAVGCKLDFVVTRADDA